MDTSRQSTSTRAPFCVALAACLTCWLMSPPASADPLALGEWLEFAFSDVGNAATGCYPNDSSGPTCIPGSGTPTTFLGAPPWTFTAPAVGATLTITDAFESGDRFLVQDLLPGIDFQYRKCVFFRQ